MKKNPNDSLLAKRRGISGTRQMLYLVKAYRKYLILLGIVAGCGRESRQDDAARSSQGHQDEVSREVPGGSQHFSKSRVPLQIFAVKKSWVSHQTPNRPPTV